jgi:hypothetical protein
MAPYVFKRNNEGIHIMNLGKTWEKLMLTARIIAAIPNPRDVLVRFHFHSLEVLTSALLLSSLTGVNGELPLYRSFQTENTHKEPFLNLQPTLKPTT